jgi:histidine triad (HIT) family protein
MSPAKPCLFCQIVAGASPAHVVLDDDVAMAFLDVRPLFPGHTLLVPRAHHETLGDLPTGLVAPLFERAQRLSRVVERGMGAAGSFVAMNNRISQSVPHLHVHVVPRNPKDGLRGFFWPRTRYDDEDAAADVATRLRKAWDEQL